MSAYAVSNPREITVSILIAVLFSHQHQNCCPLRKADSDETYLLGELIVYLVYVFYSMRSNDAIAWLRTSSILRRVMALYLISHSLSVQIEQKLHPSNHILLVRYVNVETVFSLKHKMCLKYFAANVYFSEGRQFWFTATALAWPAMGRFFISINSRTGKIICGYMRYAKTIDAEWHACVSKLSSHRFM